MIERIWIAVGLVAQGLFMGRFLVQWVISERKGESTIPVAFWYLSIAGGILLFAYACWRRDPVFILGQSTGLIVYTRNLVLLKRSRSKELQADV
ncbi:MAG TPA: lipid-A-disaccharide synthase N-terminal domain-containing protein [Candidatus Krumholzibacteria bacterium]|nr:lipid-A-disaccharide synthase N-terminal domain-containing protein [Candidatus Krumholzibacteria bacterium]